MAKSKKTEVKSATIEDVVEEPVAPAPKPAPVSTPAPKPKVSVSSEWSEKGFSSPEAYDKYKNKFS